jgi:hypothetical protein
MLDRLEATMQQITGEEKPLEQALVLGDTGFFSEGNLQEAADRGIEVLIPDPQFRRRDPYFAEKKRKKVGKKKYTKEDFTYDEETDSYICPGGKRLECKGAVVVGNNSGKKYQAAQSDCSNCALQDKCIKQTKNPDKKPARALFIAEQKHEENLSSKMREKIDDPAYRELYSRRMQIIEPPFSNITYCKGMNRFTLRTKEKVNIQRQLYCIVHNIGKCMNALGEKLAA